METNSLQISKANVLPKYYRTHNSPEVVLYIDDVDYIISALVISRTNINWSKSIIYDESILKEGHGNISRR